MESGGKSVTKRHRKKWVDALSLVLPVLLFFAVLNCFTTYLYYQDYQCKMDILTEVRRAQRPPAWMLPQDG